MQGVISAGFAIFAMFFGSGNLVCPLIIGSDHADHILLTFLGFSITAVGLPLVGMLALIRFQGNVDYFLAPLGYRLRQALVVFLLSLMGPFGIVPRNITVGYGSTLLAIPDLSLAVYSFFFCLALVLFMWHKDRVIAWIAFFLTPLKFGGVALLILVGYWQMGLPQSISLDTSGVLPGFYEGYQTMDLMASFFFSSTIYTFLQNQSPNNLMRRALYASLIGMSLLLIVYAGFAGLAAHYVDHLQGQPAEKMLPILAQIVFGNGGPYFVGFAVTMACLTTATIVSALFVDLLPIAKRSVAIGITIAITFALSLLGFAEIRIALMGILKWVYPALVLFTVWRLLQSYRPELISQNAPIEQKGI